MSEITTKSSQLNGSNNENLIVCKFNLEGNCRRHTKKDQIGVYCEYGTIKNYHFTEEEKNTNKNIRPCNFYCFTAFECTKGLTPAECLNTKCSCDNMKFGNCNRKNMCLNRHDFAYRFKNKGFETKIEENKNIETKTTETKVTNFLEQNDSFACKFNLENKCTKRTFKDDIGTFCLHNNTKNYHFTEEEKNKNRIIKACGPYCYSEFKCNQGLDPWNCIQSGCCCDNTKFGNCTNKNKCSKRHDPDFRLKNEYNKKTVNLVTETKVVERPDINTDNFPELINSRPPSPVSQTISWVIFCKTTEDSNTIYKMIRKSSKPELKVETQVDSNTDQQVDSKLSVDPPVGPIVDQPLTPRTRLRKSQKVYELSEEELNRCLKMMEDEDLNELLDFSKLDISPDVKNVHVKINYQFSESKKIYPTRIIRVLSQIDSFERKNKNVGNLENKFQEVCDIFETYREKLENKNTIPNKKMKNYKNELEKLKKSYNLLLSEVEKMIESIRLNNDSDDESDDEYFVNTRSKQKTDVVVTKDDELIRMIDSKLF